ncbi:MAG TPA: 3-deoxy-D-manno-octulosonic acid transferase [Rhodobacteraceae bacterium]|nr:3-deoxy-D-manno-octulosonic acid transferase [Paracoccaceae bacterium]
MNTTFTTPKMRIALLLYAGLWFILLPVVIAYIYWRARRDPRYSKHLGERFGNYPVTCRNPVWVHAVSLGEMRAAAPLIRTLIDQGETVVTTHFTPAGREAAQKMFPAECAAGQIVPVYVPLEFDWVYRRFFKAFAPKYGLVMEIEMWPRMIASANRHSVPLFMCNGHYPEKSFQRDKKRAGLRGQLVTGFTGMLIKSAPDAERFKAFGARNVIVTGELRFDQVIPPNLTAAADTLLRNQPEIVERTIVTFASVVEGEDTLYIEAIHRIQKNFVATNRPEPLFIYVPRAPERFADVGEMLEQAGLNLIRRGTYFDQNLAPRSKVDLSKISVLLGDSLGEMYFYLSLADFVVVGGGFVPTGAHNVIEPLALKKPVLVGPHIWTIEYPALEAIEAGVLTKVDTIEGLATEIGKLPKGDAQTIRINTAFYQEHTGAVPRSLKAISDILDR